MVKDKEYGLIGSDNIFCGNILNIDNIQIAFYFYLNITLIWFSILLKNKFHNSYPTIYSFDKKNKRHVLELIIKHEMPTETMNKIEIKFSQRLTMLMANTE